MKKEPSKACERKRTYRLLLTRKPGQIHRLLYSELHTDTLAVCVSAYVRVRVCVYMNILYVRTCFTLLIRL